MKYKYAKQGHKRPGDGGNGRYVDPEVWITGPDPLTREKYYAFLKHRAQARFRKEPYDLDWDDWQAFWDDDNFLKRGRGKDDYCLTRTNLREAWSVSNCYVATRQHVLERMKEFRENKSAQ